MALKALPAQTGGTSASGQEIPMDIRKVPIGRNPPHEINVVIEVPLRSDPIKYEFDKDSGAIFVDRFLYTTMFYPCNYGFVPHTLADDGDPIDVMVVGRMPVQPGAVLPARPIGVLELEDEAGGDEKILAVPLPRITQIYDRVASWRDLPEIDLKRIQHFFEHYKDLEPEKWVRVGNWRDPEVAHGLITAAIVRATARSPG
jgi:inorganic pyrophosphatase